MSLPRMAPWSGDPPLCSWGTSSRRIVAATSLPGRCRIRLHCGRRLGWKPLQIALWWVISKLLYNWWNNSFGSPGRILEIALWWVISYGPPITISKMLDTWWNNHNNLFWSPWRCGVWECTPMRKCWAQQSRCSIFSKICPCVTSSANEFCRVKAIVTRRELIQPRFHIFTTYIIACLITYYWYIKSDAML